jgi:DNA-binding GntR family transcriptional regulator
VTCDPRVVAGFGATAEVDFRVLFAPLVNDEADTHAYADAAAALVGAQDILLEPMLAQRACPRSTAAQLAEAEACHEIMRATTDPERWSVLNEEFHAHLVATETHTRLFDITALLAGAARAYVVLSLHVQPEIIAGNNRDHENLLHAYKARDENAVFEQTRLHLATTRDTISACVEQSLRPSMLPTR